MKNGKKKSGQHQTRRNSRTTRLAQATRTGRKPALPRTPKNAIFSSSQAAAIKSEICAAGRKLWMRQYVDGNGGNISFRIGPNAVLCTPSLVSKFDLTPEDICLTDIDGHQLAGSKPRSSELLLHLEIYKAVPEAKAVVHCHPPHATAYAITGCLPPNLIIPEFEVIVGNVAVAPYETPGTKAFAETVLPYVKSHNTMLLANHGIVCWADTVTRAEWCAEVLDTYCWTLMLAAQLGAPILRISEERGADLRALRKKLGLPEFPFDMPPLNDANLAVQSPIALQPTSRGAGNGSASQVDSAGGSDGIGGPNFDALVKAITESVMAAIAEKYTLVPRKE
ncbi:MAG: class II aldolase/adducin family protein [Terracidiphilus sp.]